MNMCNMNKFVLNISKCSAVPLSTSKKENI